MDCIIQSLCSPLLKDCSRIELPRLSLDGNQFGCAEIHSIITTLFQTNFLILSQINSKKYQFHTFFMRSNLQMGICMKVIRSV